METTKHFNLIYLNMKNFMQTTLTIVPVKCIILCYELNEGEIIKVTQKLAAKHFILANKIVII